MTTVKVILKDVKTGKIIAKNMPLRYILDYQDAAGFIRLPDGKIYRRMRSLEENMPVKIASRKRQAYVPAKYPYFSDAMGVAPSQIPEAKRKLAALGVRVEYTPDGRAIIESPAHRKRLAEAMGLHDRNSYGTRYEARYKPYRVV
ncbi:MAG: hypothetical protein QW761_00200 [Candidatus Aenigmatarchaeota archaeon]